jgi:hypothetical protein
MAQLPEKIDPDRLNMYDKGSREPSNSELALKLNEIIDYLGELEADRVQPEGGAEG